VYSVEHCCHCTKKTKHQEKKEKTDRSIFSVDLNVDSVLDEWLPAEESSMSVMQLPEKHDHQWYGATSFELTTPRVNKKAYS